MPEELRGAERVRAAEARDLERCLARPELVLERLGDDRPVDDQNEGIGDAAAGSRQRRLRVEAREPRWPVGVSVRRRRSSRLDSAARFRGGDVAGGERRRPGEGEPARPVGAVETAADERRAVCAGGEGRGSLPDLHVAEGVVTRRRGRCARRRARTRGTPALAPAARASAPRHAAAIRESRTGVYRRRCAACRPPRSIRADGRERERPAAPGRRRRLRAGRLLRGRRAARRRRPGRGRHDRAPADAVGARPARRRARPSEDQVGLARVREDRRAARLPLPRQRRGRARPRPRRTRPASTTRSIYAVGAQTDRRLGIPGEDLPGSWAATEFVAWYNGHPDYQDLEFDLDGRARGRDRERQRRGRRRAHARAHARGARADRHDRRRDRRDRGAGIRRRS